MLNRVRERALRTPVLVQLVAGAVALAVVSSAGEAWAQGLVLPLPASDQQQLANYLGAGVVGAARPSERILDAGAYFPLQDKTLIFKVTSGGKAGDTQHLGLKKTRRPSGTPAWRFQFTPTLAAFITPERSGDLTMSAVSDSDEGVVAVTTPANPFVLIGMGPGESRSFSQTVSVNYLDDPTRRDWGGSLNAVYTYVGTYQVQVPAGAFTAILFRIASHGKVGPADVTYTAWYLFARDVGLVAMVNLEDVSAFWVYHVDTTIGKVLAVK
jgi:hypothetical protein